MYPLDGGVGGVCGSGEGAELSLVWCMLSLYGSVDTESGGCDRLFSCSHFAELPFLVTARPMATVIARFVEHPTMEREKRCVGS